MNIAVIHLGDITQCLVASSLNKKIRGTAKDAKIYWIVNNEESLSILKNNSKITGVMLIGDFAKSPIKFDILFNLSPAFKKEYLPKNCEAFGFNFNKKAGNYYDILYGNEKSRMNLFQVYFKIVDLSWHGESYDFSYFPKSRSKKNRAGIAIAHANLRNYVIDNLHTSKNMKTWLVPYKKNIFKRLDEINRCEHIITDDTLTMHLAINLRKFVHYLDSIPRNTKLEFFGKGKVYDIPNNYLK